MPDQPAPAILFAHVVARGETVGEIAARGLAQALNRRPGPRPERLFVSVLRRGADMPFDVGAVRDGQAGYRLLLDTPIAVCPSFYRLSSLLTPLFSSMRPWMRDPTRSPLPCIPTIVSHPPCAMPSRSTSSLTPFTR